VRVDILERLADLIRPALAWRSGAPGAKPPGAIEGFCFTVSGGMTSLAGCSGENFASVLRSLGYRMERRPKPVEPAPAPVEATAQPAHTVPPAVPTAAPVAASVRDDEAVADRADKPGEAEAPALPQVADADDAAAAAPMSEGEAIAETADQSPETESPELAQVRGADEAAAASPVEALAQASAPPQTFDEAPGPASLPPLEALSGDTVQPVASAATAAKSESEEFIEVWRPGRRDEHARKPHHQRRARPRRSPAETQAPPLAADAPATSAERAAAPPPARREARDRVARPERQRDGDRPERRSARPKRAEHAQGDGDRAPRGDRAGRAPRGDRPDRDPALRAKYIKGRGEAGERREPDPNSPFAKLAALKQQLEASNKEPR
jgi:ATP-dependent RNA helicase SUPV3L1/SUV3